MGARRRPEPCAKEENPHDATPIYSFLPGSSLRDGGRPPAYEPTHSKAPQTPPRPPIRPRNHPQGRPARRDNKRTCRFLGSWGQNRPALGLRTRLTGVARGYTGAPRGRDTLPGPERRGWLDIRGRKPGGPPFLGFGPVGRGPARGPMRAADGAHRHRRPRPAAPLPPAHAGATAPGDLGLGGTGGPRGRGIARHFGVPFLSFQSAQETPSPLPRPSADLGSLISTVAGVVGLCTPPSAAA